MTSMNPATQPSDELNDFTQAVNQLGRGIKQGSVTFEIGEYWVKLRNGDLVRPVLYEVPEDMVGLEEPHFYTINRENSGYRWNLDGTSLKNRNYDMMEIIRND